MQKINNWFANKESAKLKPNMMKQQVPFTPFQDINYELLLQESKKLHHK